MKLDKLEEMLDEGGIVFLTYGGLFSQELIVAMTEALERESEVNDLSMKVANRILTIFIELSQNMMSYAKHHSLDKIRTGNSSGLIVVGHQQDNDSYYVLSRNIITNEDQKYLKQKIDPILHLDQDELRNLYRELRRSGKDKHKKGAGIGFVEIARKSDQIEYQFLPVDDTYSYFIFKSIISN